MLVGGQRHNKAALHTTRDTVHTVEEAEWAAGMSGRVRKISPTPGFDYATV